MWSRFNLSAALAGYSCRTNDVCSTNSGGEFFMAFCRWFIREASSCEELAKAKMFPFCFLRYVKNDILAIGKMHSKQPFLGKNTLKGSQKSVFLFFCRRPSYLLFFPAVAKSALIFTPLFCFPFLWGGKGKKGTLRLHKKWGKCCCITFASPFLII